MIGELNVAMIMNEGKTRMRLFYGTLSVAGFLLPVLCFSMHFSRRGETAWSEFFSAPFATWVISGFTWDLLITATAATVWIKSESRRLKMTGFGWHFLATFAVGICFALPTFLFRREAYLNKEIPSKIAGLDLE